MMAVIDKLGFQPIDGLGNNMGVPLLHKRVSSSTCPSIVEKFHGRLNRWDAKLLSLDGRVILVKSNFTTISNYFMQTIMLSVCIYNEIEKLVRGSI